MGGAALQLGGERQREGQALEVERQSSQSREAGHDGEHGPIERGDGADKANRQSESRHAAECQTLRVLAQRAGRPTPASGCADRLAWRSGPFCRRGAGQRQGGQHRGVDRREADLVAAFGFDPGKRGLGRLE